jgi:hypothetical protein
VSLMIGIGTHLFWDSFTHGDGWIVGHLSILRTPVFVFAGRTARVCQVFWYVSSFVGVGWLWIAFENWKSSKLPGRKPVPVGRLISSVALLSILIIPVSLVRHLVRDMVGFILTAVLCTLLVILFAVRMTRTRRGMRPW